MNVDQSSTSTQPATAPARHSSDRRPLEWYLEQGQALHRDNRYEEAASAYRQALEIDEHNWNAIIGHNRAIRRCVPRWHFEMMHDDERADLYDKAIRDVVKPRDTLLDIGTGSGLLALMAARAGAGTVVACEGQPDVAQVARGIVERAGYGSQISVLSKMSTDMRIPQDLPRRANVLVTEIVDCGLLGEGILYAMEHAREHLLTPDALIMPGSARVLAQLVESVPLFRKNRVGEHYGFDLSGFNELASMEYFDSRLRRHEHRVLSSPFEVFRFDFRHDGPQPRRGHADVPPIAAGSCHAIVFWFEMELIPGITVTNSPDNPTTHWKQAVQCLPAPIDVRPGTPVPIEFRHDGLHIHFASAGSYRD